MQNKHKKTSREVMQDVFSEAIVQCGLALEHFEGSGRRRVWKGGWSQRFLMFSVKKGVCF